MSVAGAKRTSEGSNAHSGVATPAAAAAAVSESASRVTMRSTAGQSPQLAAAAAESVAPSLTGALLPTHPLSLSPLPIASAMDDALADEASHSESASEASDSGSVSAASPAASPSQPGRSVALPSLFSRDPLGLILSFVLIDLPVARGQPYFPKELVRIVREYAAEPCIVVECATSSFAGPASLKRTVFGSPSEFLRWLGSKLPPGLDSCWLDEQCLRRCNDLDASELAIFNSCVMESNYGDELLLLLHAQLEPNEYRLCVLEVPQEQQPSMRGAERMAHSCKCLRDLNKRKAAIVARGQTAVPVGVGELLKRVRWSLLDGELPRGMSPRPCDWTPLFGWIRGFYVEWNKRAYQTWLEDPDEPGDPFSFEPPLCAVLLQQDAASDGASIAHHTDACLWSHDQTRKLWMEPDLIVSEYEGDADDDGEDPAASEPSSSSSTSSSAAAAATSSSHAASSSSAPPSSLSADDEALSRAAPRPRRA